MIHCSIQRINKQPQEAALCAILPLHTGQSSWWRSLRRGHKPSRAPRLRAQDEAHAWPHQALQIDQLVYFEVYDSPAPAIQREKNIKHWPRAWKQGSSQRRIQPGAISTTRLLRLERRNPAVDYIRVVAWLVGDLDCDTAAPNYRGGRDKPGHDTAERGVRPTGVRARCKAPSRRPLPNSRHTRKHLFECGPPHHRIELHQRHRLQRLPTIIPKRQH